MYHGFAIINEKKSIWLATVRNCALQAYRAGIEQGLYKDDLDAAKKGYVVAYVQIETIEPK